MKGIYAKCKSNIILNRWKTNHFFNITVKKKNEALYFYLISYWKSYPLQKDEKKKDKKDKERNQIIACQKHHKGRQLKKEMNKGIITNSWKTINKMTAVSPSIKYFKCKWIKFTRKKPSRVAEWVRKKKLPTSDSL